MTVSGSSGGYVVPPYLNLPGQGFYRISFAIRLGGDTLPTDFGSACWIVLTSGGGLTISVPLAQLSGQWETFSGTSENYGAKVTMSFYKYSSSECPETATFLLDDILVTMYNPFSLPVPRLDSGF